MSTKTRAKTAHFTTVHHVNTENEEKPVMSTKSHGTKSTHATSTDTANQETKTMSATQSTTPTPATTTTPAAPAPAPSPQPPPVVFVAGPPSTVSIPQVEYEPASPGEFKTVVPRAGERTAMAQALVDLAAFTNYQQALGTSAPDYGEVVQAFTVGAQWTASRSLATRWDGYCVVQEGLAWRAIRLLMARLVPAFELAATSNPKLLTQFPGLASLLGAKKVIARRAASTKKLNEQAVAEGKPPVHGVVGKRRQKKAEKAAAAAAQSSGTSAPAAPAPAPVAAPVNGVASGAAH